ncbi:MAG: hypothetical protein HC901_03135 [Bdellovibrionaceae bacterium]|nr:hypothetical protein [Pseudobdellovibrionaceae bacterium]
MLLVLWAGGSVWAERILIDFGSDNNRWQMESPDEQGNHWNNMVSVKDRFDEHVAADLVTTKGRETGIRIEVAEPFARALLNQDKTMESLYPIYATDRWVIQGKEKGKLRLRGLRAGESYILSFYATRGETPEAMSECISQFTVGGESKQLNILNNLKECAVFENVTCGQDGTLMIEVSAGKDGGRDQGAISVLEIGYGGGAGPAEAAKTPQKATTVPVKPAATPAPPPERAAPAPVAPSAVVVEQEGTGGTGMRAIMGGDPPGAGVGCGWRGRLVRLAEKMNKREEPIDESVFGGGFSGGVGGVVLRAGSAGGAIIDRFWV